MKFTEPLDLVLTPERMRMQGYSKRLAVGFGLLVFLATHAWHYHDLSGRLASQELLKTAQLQAPKITPTASETELKTVAVIRSMTHQLLTPWETLLTAVEQSWAAPLTLVSLTTQPDAAKLLITVSAPKFQHIHDFVQTLSEQRVLRYVQLQSEMTQDRQSSEWQAVVQAHWVE